MLLIHTSTAEVHKSCKQFHTIIGEVENDLYMYFISCKRMSVAALLSKWCPILKS